MLAIGVVLAALVLYKKHVSPKVNAYLQRKLPGWMFTKIGR